MLILVAGVILLCIAFIVAGDFLVEQMKTVKIMREARQFLANLKLNKPKIQANADLSVLSKRELHEITISQSFTHNGIDFTRREFGRALRLIHESENDLSDSVSELKKYAFLTVVLCLVGIGKYFGENNYVFDLKAFFVYVEGNPFKFLSVFELAALGIFIVRFRMILTDMRNLIHH